MKRVKFTVENVYEESPTVELDMNVTGGKTYKELDASASAYTGALVVTGGVSQNYDISTIAGTLVVSPADIGTARFEAQAEKTMYNAEAQTAQVTVVDTAFGQEYTLSYEGDLVNAGTVTIVINGMGAYTGSTTRTYQIKPAQLLVHTFDAAKTYDGTPLVGEGEVWRLVGDETVTLTVTGTQTEIGSSPNTYTLTWNGTAKEGNYEVDENVGTLTVNAPDTVYYCESGADGVWTNLRKILDGTGGS